MVARLRSGDEVDGFTMALGDRFVKRIV